MILSDISVDRPVFATVISLILVVFGAMAFSQLPLREYPDVNPPIVSVETKYTGAAAAIVETKITQVLEDRISGIEGIKTIDSKSRDGLSSITIEFTLSRDIDAAANDVRERLSRVLGNLPDEADAPEIFKVDSNTSVILWLNLASDTLNPMALADFARRNLVDRLSVIDGVARVRVGTSRDYAMRIWLDRTALAARNLTVNDVENVLRRENVELPAGRVESITREFTVRVSRSYNSADDFAAMVISESPDGHLTRLGDVAQVEIGAGDYRSEMRGNGELMLGLGIVKQSRANTLAVTRAVKKEVTEINKTLPDGIVLHNSYDTSIFIDQAIDEVYKTLFIAGLLVVIVIYLFLGNARAMLIPAVTVPVSIISAFIFLYIADFSINLLTLLAMVLSIGLVVDDAILVLENIYRRIESGEPPLVAAHHGARQVGFAVIATTIVLISVFVPIIFIEGNTGRLFTEFAMAMAAAVAFSSLVALTLAPMLCSKLLRKRDRNGRFGQIVDRLFQRFEGQYEASLHRITRHPLLLSGLLLAILVGSWFLFTLLPAEFAPKEDRGSFAVIVSAPEGTGYDAMQDNMRDIEQDLLPLVERQDANRILVRVPGSFGSTDLVNSGISFVLLDHWDNRDKSAWDIMGELSGKFAKHPEVRAFPVMRQGLSRGYGKPVQFVLQGNDYEQLAKWRDHLIRKASENPNLIALDSDYKETKPQLVVDINRNRAADLGVSLQNIGRTLETLLGSRKVTTYIDRGEEYDVILEARKGSHQTPGDLSNIYVRSERSGELIPLSNLVTTREVATAATLNRYNRMRAITIDALVVGNYTVGDALAYLEDIVANEMPNEVSYDYKGESLDFKESGQSVAFVFVLALIVVYLVLAAQFESFRHPLIIMLTVPLAIAGAFIGLYLTGQTLNIYSQIALIMLIGLAAKNGILIVEFANQLRDKGVEFSEAIHHAAALRLRPIIMTAITTIMGAMALIFSSGAGAETRYVIGVVVISGVLAATFLTLYIVPTAYLLIARGTGSPQATQQTRERQEKELNRDIT